MAVGRTQRRELYLGKARADLAELERLGLRMAGNAFSSVLLLKGLPNEAEKNGEAPLSGADGGALRAALTALGYAPEDWCALLACDGEGTPLAGETLRLAVCALDPATLVACDDQAASVLREAYADELAQRVDFDEAMLAPGRVVLLLGMRVMVLDGFEAALGDAHRKQVMWARLKQLPPLGEPY